MNGRPSPFAKLDAAIERVAKLLDIDLALATEQALAILETSPSHPPAVLLVATAHRRAGDLAASLALLDPLVAAQPNWASAHFEQGLVLARAGRDDEAILAMNRTVAINPDHPEAWRVLAKLLLATDDSAAADSAYARHIQCPSRETLLRQAAVSMNDNDLPRAEVILQQHLKKTPTDAPALRMLAEVAVRRGQNEKARPLLEKCLELAPDFAPARLNYATLLQRTAMSAQALVEIERLLADDPQNPGYRNLLAVILSRIGEYQRCAEIYAQLLDERPGNAKVWLSYGHVLKTLGRNEEGIAAYRNTLAHEPSFGEAYWSLANLKTFRFTDADLAAMQELLADDKLEDAKRVHLHFSLGKAAEDAGDYAESFQHYSKGNALRCADVGYDASANTTRADHLQGTFNREFFQSRSGPGCETQAPIFIVGMPRAGSTLLEQILSSHSAVEGTAELPEIMTIVKNLRKQSDRTEVVAFTEVLGGLSSAQLRELGEEYIERSRVHRKTDRPFFIDKMPGNYLHIGMIHLILPNAKIIDARRHPMGCCFSNFKQLYARGQNFSYKLEDAGNYYRDYVNLMAHFDTVLAGRVHRVIYEEMVENTETEVRKLLDYCGLDFEPGCLRFFENERAVRTPSAEQVRQPIYRDGTELWQNYEAWLDPLKEALGPVLDAYPAAPRL